MAETLWTFEKLAWYARSEDPEVRYWAVERLVRCFSESAPAAIALLLLDEHDTTPELVAENLRDHGTPEHVPLLLRAWRQMRGTVPGKAYEALARLEYPKTLDLARSAVDRVDLSEESLGLVVAATARITSEESSAVVKEIVERKVEVLSDPNALRGALEAYRSEELPSLLSSFAKALQWRGLGRSADLLRAITDHVEADDCAWCLRTGPDGRLDLRKTIKAFESSYDCELIGVAPALTPELVRDLTLGFRSGELAGAIASLSSAVREHVSAVSADTQDPLPGRLSAMAGALAAPVFRAEADRLGPVFLQGVVSVLLSCLFKVARYRNYAREVEKAAGDIDALLGLAEEETAFLLDLLPKALVKAIDRPPPEQPEAESAGTDRVLEWCRRMLEARGPFFPKAVALETIGEMRAEDHVPELLDALADENSYTFGAAEKALSKIGSAIVGPMRARLEAGALDHEALHSLLILLVELGDRAALSMILDNFEDFVERVGAGETAEWTALMGAKELFEPLHRLLQKDVARVGQALLLLGAIHNIPVAEEAQIQQAIEEYWRRHPETEGAGGDDEGGSGSYVM